MRVPELKNNKKNIWIDRCHLINKNFPNINKSTDFCIVEYNFNKISNILQLEKSINYKIKSF
jgi:hypothetical protein